MTAALVLEGTRELAETEEREITGFGSVRKVGWLLTRMGVPKAQRHERRVYLRNDDLMRPLRAAYLSPPACDVQITEA